MSAFQLRAKLGPRKSGVYCVIIAAAPLASTEDISSSAPCTIIRWAGGLRWRRYSDLVDIPTLSEVLVEERELSLFDRRARSKRLWSLLAAIETRGVRGIGFAVEASEPVR